MSRAVQWRVRFGRGPGFVVAHATRTSMKCYGRKLLAGVHSHSIWPRAEP